MAAAPDLQLCSAQDIIDMAFAGDTAEVIKLCRVDPTAWDPALLLVPIKMGSAEVETAAGNRYNLAPPPAGQGVEVYPYHLRMTAALRAVYWAWFSFARGQAMTEQVKAAATTGETMLKDLRDSKAGPGTQKPPPSRISGTAQIDMTSGGRFPRMSLEGWRLL